MATPESVAGVDKAGARAGAEPEPEGACGWSKPQTSLELMCGADADGVRHHLIVIINKVKNPDECV